MPNTLKYGKLGIAKSNYRQVEPYAKSFRRANPGAVALREKMPGKAGVATTQGLAP